MALVLLLPLVASAFRQLRGGKVKGHTLEPTHCDNKGKAWTKQFCGVPSSNLSSSKVIDFSNVQASPICSQLNQDRYLDAIFKAIGTTNTYFVEFGSRRPEVLNSAHFRLNCGWKGLLMDGAPGASVHGPCPSCPGQELLQAADDAPVRLRQAFLTAENISDKFQMHQVPCQFDLLTVDVDWNDYWLVKALDFGRFQPRVVAIEFSSYFRGSEKQVRSYKSDGVWGGEVTGASLAALDGLMRAKGYKLVAQVAGEHGIWVSAKEMNPDDHAMKIPDVVSEGWQFGMRQSGANASGFEEVTDPCADFGCQEKASSCGEGGDWSFGKLLSGLAQPPSASQAAANKGGDNSNKGDGDRAI